MKSKTLEASEAVSQSFIDRSVDIESKLLTQAPDGKIHFKPVKASSDYVVIAPIARERRGMIITPNADSNIGLFVGWGVMAPEQCKQGFPIGTTVRFAGTPVADLTGEFSSYGNAQVFLMRYTSILVAVPQIDVVEE